VRRMKCCIMGRIRCEGKCRCRRTNDNTDLFLHAFTGQSVPVTRDSSIYGDLRSSVGSDHKTGRCGRIHQSTTNLHHTFHVRMDLRSSPPHDVPSMYHCHLSTCY